MVLSIVKFILLFFSCLDAQKLNSDAESEYQDDGHGTTTFSSNEITPDPFGYRISLSLKPIHYFIKIFPISTDEKIRFRGFVQIDFEVVNETRIIALNMAAIELERDSLQVTIFSCAGDKSVNITEVKIYPEKELVTFELEISATVGKRVRLSSYFSGSLVANSYGLNQFFYDDENGINRRFLATYFQPVGARRVFPCFDEPNVKANFTLVIGSQANEFVLSNMPVNRTLKGENSSYIWTEFEMSVPMSTYLVAFLISDFKMDLAFTAQTTKVWSRKEVHKESSFASILGPKVLKWYESYFGVSYPLSKLDLVTLPSYPVPGMENFGLIFSREDSLTTNGKVGRKDWVATVTAHEIAHQWVGNLVTPIWWSEYWLSEGFATYFAARALDEIEPELEATNNLITESTRLILVQDEGDRASDLIVKKFDPLTESSKNVDIYYKGAAVLRMLNTIVGEKLFSKAIKIYFNKFKFSSAAEEDFYSVITGELAFFNKTLPTSLNKIMATWTTQNGFPLVMVERKHNGSVTVRQEYFESKMAWISSHELASQSTDSNLTWWIPISFYTSRNPDFSMAPKAWLSPTRESMVLDISNEDHWMVINSKQASYLRVNYDKGLWKAISDQLILDHHQIHVLNRAQLFEDAFHLFDSGHLDSKIPLDLMFYLAKERDFIPLKAALRRFSEVEILMRGNIHYTLLKQFLKSIISPQLEAGFGTNHTETKRYNLVMSWSCKIQSLNCTALANQLFSEWKINNNINIFPEGEMDALFCAAIESGTNEDWKVAFDRVFSEVKLEGKKKIRNSLSCSKNKTEIEGYLNFILHGNHNLTDEDVKDVFDNLVRSVRWNHFTWTFLNQNLDKLAERFNDIPPIPFISTPYDFQQFVQILKKLSPENLSAILEFISESQNFSKSAERTILQVSQWLIKNAPFTSSR